LEAIPGFDELPKEWIANKAFDMAVQERNAAREELAALREQEKRARVEARERARREEREE
jgi:hypothetical protein